MDFESADCVGLRPSNPMTNFSNGNAAMLLEPHWVDAMNPIELVREIAMSLTHWMWNFLLLEHILVKECL